jgi:hypothetical protein
MTLKPPITLHEEDKRTQKTMDIYPLSTESQAAPDTK